jgi:hypothetical protein
MDESLSEIEREIRAGRQQLGRNLNELEMKAKQLADWRTYYRNNPTLLLGFALGGGLVLGAIAGGARSSRGEDPSEKTAGRSPRGSAAGRQIEDTWQLISNALLGLGAAKVMEFVSQVVPGFTDQLNRRSSNESPGSPVRVADVRDTSSIM